MINQYLESMRTNYALNADKGKFIKQAHTLYLIALIMIAPFAFTLVIAKLDSLADESSSLEVESNRTISKLDKDINAIGKDVNRLQEAGEYPYRRPIVLLHHRLAD